MQSPLSEETLRAIVEGASDGMFISDESFRMEWVNPAGCALLGHPLEALLGKRVSDLFWDPNELVRSPLRREDLLAALAKEHAENELFPTTDNTEDWLKLTDFDPENVVRLGPVRPRKAERSGVV